MKRLRQLLFWTAPPVLLLLVLRSVDLPALGRVLRTVEFAWVATGVICSLLTVLTGAFRWRTVLQDFAAVRASWRYAARHYWVSLALGFVSPGQLGGDVYRTIVAGRSFGRPVRVAAGIVAEKVVALLSAVALVLLMFPLVAVDLIQDHELATQIMTGSSLIAFALVAGLAAVIATLARPSAAAWIAGRVQRVMAGVSRSVPGMGVDVVPDRGALAVQFSTWGRPAPLLRLLALSLVIQLLAAASSQFAFQALDQNVPFLVNLFVSPILFFALLLPISFAGIGIREGAFVLLYGAFGVSPEVALAASFITLLGVLLNNAVGAALIGSGRQAPPTPVV